MPALTGAAAISLLALVGVASAATAPEEQNISPSVFVKLLASGPVGLTGVRIEGDLDLGNGVVRNRLSCRDCRFAGDLIARDATFKKHVDLSGSDITGKVDLVGATLERGLVAFATTFHGIVDLRDTEIGGRADLSEARFEGPVLFGAPPTAEADGATFDGDVDFSRATFGTIASFEATFFEGNVNFTMARFDADVVFADGESSKRAAFARAIFGSSVDFSDFEFGGKASFEGAKFPGPAVFSGSNFERQATFDRTRFDEGATFLAVTFPSTPNVVDSFAEVQSNGDLNFSFAEFHRPADFEDMAATGTISFSGALLTAENGLHFLNLSAGAFNMDVGRALAVVKPGDRIEVLALIESSAKARDELSVANAAHYARQKLQSQQYWFPSRVFDFIFYRTLAGYFVRPFHPLIALLILAALMTLLQVARAHRPVPGGGTRPRHWSREDVWRGARQTSAEVRQFGHAYIDTLALAGPARGESSDERKARRIEIVVYRLFLVCALIGFANSNPTLREMFDAIR